MKSAPVQEIFSSIQGEGPWVGQRHIFVRFSGCDIRCRYCDTPAASRENANCKNQVLCRAQTAVDSLTFDEVPGLMTPSEVTHFCSRLVVHGPSHPTLSITGGEPLLHVDFLAEWLPTVRSRFMVYLETNGLRYSAMERLREMVDVVSMDFKLPSAAGLGAFWDEHRKFLDAAAGTKRIVKIVVTNDTVKDDVIASANLIAQCAPGLPLIIQPASGHFAPQPQLLLDFQNTALGIIADVRVIPQVHTLLTLP